MYARLHPDAPKKISPIPKDKALKNIQKSVDNSLCLCYNKGVGVTGNGCFPLVIKKITAMLEQGGYLFLLLLSNDITEIINVARSIRSRHVM